MNTHVFVTPQENFGKRSVQKHFAWPLELGDNADLKVDLRQRDQDQGLPSNPEQNIFNPLNQNCSFPAKVAKTFMQYYSFIFLFVLFFEVMSHTKSFIGSNSILLSSNFLIKSDNYYHKA